MQVSLSEKKKKNYVSGDGRETSLVLTGLNFRKVIPHIFARHVSLACGVKNRSREKTN